MVTDPIYDPIYLVIDDFWYNENMQKQKLSLLMKIVAVLLLVLGLLETDLQFLSISYEPLELFNETFIGFLMIAGLGISGVFILLHIKRAWYLAVLSIISIILWILSDMLYSWNTIGDFSLFLMFILLFLGMLCALSREKKRYFNLKTTWTKKRITLSTLIGILFLSYFGLPIIFHIFSYCNYHYNNDHNHNNRNELPNWVR